MNNFLAGRLRWSRYKAWALATRVARSYSIWCLYAGISIAITQEVRKTLKNSAVADTDTQKSRKVANSTVRMVHVFETVGDIFSIFCPHTFFMSSRKKIVYSIELPFIRHTLNYYRKLILIWSTREKRVSACNHQKSHLGSAGIENERRQQK
jgi:hypothetical protein